MKSIEKRIRRLEEAMNISELPTYKEFMNDFEGRCNFKNYFSLKSNNILARKSG